MRALKTISTLPNFRLGAKKTKEFPPKKESIPPRFEMKTKGIFGEKDSNSLLALMYSQENEFLFI